mmetsp:Transcript_1111/g.3452  ORF Transcript_1111/g.3452 Transcript_1111/m.3452 type:complete len:161 (-) Transcript_1111:124-606(-)
MGCFGRSDGWERTVFWGNIIVGILLIAAGVVSIVFFFTSIVASLSNPVSFAVFVYAIISGVLLLAATLGRPRSILNSFGFLKGHRLRGLFEFFMSTLCLGAGFTGSVGSVANIMLLIAGFPAIVLSPLTFFYGTDYVEVDESGTAGGNKTAPNLPQVSVI